MEFSDAIIIIFSILYIYKTVFYRQFYTNPIEYHSTLDYF